MEKMVRAHAVELMDHSPTIEIGVGTGRFARPLHSAGLGMVGIDLSRPMLAKLVENAGGVLPFPLIEGDATRLPFATGVFGSALVVHVFHLIPDWEDAAREVLRVLRSGGRLLLDFGDKGGGDWDRMLEVFVSASGVPETNVGANDPEEVHEFFVASGAMERDVEGFIEQRTWSYGEVVEQLEKGIFSATWRTDDEGRKAGAEEVRAWMAEEQHGMKDTFETKRMLRWHSYELP